MLKILIKHIVIKRRFLFLITLLCTLSSIAWLILINFTTFYDSNYEKYQSKKIETLSIDTAEKINPSLQKYNRIIIKNKINNPATSHNNIISSNSVREINTNDKYLNSENSNNSVLPMIAIIIDDAGLNYSRLRRLMDISKDPLNIAFLPYGNNLQEQVNLSIENNYQVLVHLPMEPFDKTQNPGPNALTINISQSELYRRLDWNLKQFTGYIGVNNHMGSRFTSDRNSVISFLKEIKKRNLLFLDSHTSSTSKVYSVAKDLNIVTLKRDIFIDNDLSVEKILNQLKKLETISNERGYAIGIGHLQNLTIDALSIWIPKVKEKGFLLVGIDKIAKQIK